MNRKSVWAALATLLAIPQAHAELVRATFHSVTPSRTVALSLDGGLRYGHYYAGLLNWTEDAPSARIAPEFETFCIELTEYVSFGRQYNYSITDPSMAPSALGGMGLTKAALLAELYGRFYATADFTLADVTAAFQIATWEIVHDTGLNLAAGSLRVQNSGRYWQLADSMLDELTGSGPRMSLMALSARGVQDQIVVPEPAAAVLLLVACIAAWRARAFGRAASTT